MSWNLIQFDVFSPFLWGKLPSSRRGSYRKGGQSGASFPQVISPWRHQLVGPSSFFVFGHRFTRVCLTPIHRNPTGTKSWLLLWNAWCWRSQSAFKSLWDTSLLGFGKTPGVGSCCFLKFSVGQSILEKKVMAIKRDSTLECAEPVGVGEWGVGGKDTFPPSHYVSPNVVSGLGALSILISAVGCKAKPEKDCQAIFFSLPSFWRATSLSGSNGPGCPHRLNKKKVQKNGIIRRGGGKKKTHIV